MAEDDSMWRAYERANLKLAKAEQLVKAAEKARSDALKKIVSKKGRGPHLLDGSPVLILCRFEDDFHYLRSCPVPRVKYCHDHDYD